VRDFQLLSEFAPERTMLAVTNFDVHRPSLLGICPHNQPSSGPGRFRLDRKWLGFFHVGTFHIDAMNVNDMRHLQPWERP
jgi:hypothetical protein